MLGEISNDEDHNSLKTNSTYVTNNTIDTNVTNKGVTKCRKSTNVAVTSTMRYPKRILKWVSALLLILVS